jgi:hypothetical protein
MMAAVSYLSGVVILIAWPVYRFLLLQFETPGVTAGVLPLVLGASGALALTAVCIVAAPSGRGQGAQARALAVAPADIWQRPYGPVSMPGTSNLEPQITALTVESRSRRCSMQ